MKLTEKARKLMAHLDSLRDQIDEHERRGDQLLADDVKALWRETERKLEEELYG